MSAVRERLPADLIARLMSGHVPARPRMEPALTLDERVVLRAAADARGMWPASGPATKAAAERLTDAGLLARGRFAGYYALTGAGRQVAEDLQ